MTKVSIIVTCYNKDSYIAETIKSVLLQTYTNFELIIINDGSTDNSLEIIESFTDKRIILCNQINGGENSARNRGISMVSGEYIAFLDGDDIWESTKIEEQINYIEKNNFDMCFCNYNIIDKEGILNFFFFKLDFLNYSYSSLKNKILTGNYILGSASSVVVKKDIVNKVGFFDTNLKWGGDWEYWIRIVFTTKEIGFLDKELVSIRFGIEQVQSTLTKTIRLNDTKLILNKCLKSYNLNNYEKSLVYLSISRTIYNYNGSLKEILTSYLKSIKLNFSNILKFDIMFLIIKYIIKKSINYAK